MLNRKIEKTHFKGEPVVIVSLKDWKKLELLMEEEEMRNSLSFQKAVKEGRRDIAHGKLFELDFKTGRFKKTKYK